MFHYAAVYSPKQQEPPLAICVCWFLYDLSLELLRDSHNETAFQINSFAPSGWPPTRTSTIQNRSTVKVTAPSKVQPQLYSEGASALKHHGKEMSPCSILMFMTQEPLGDSDRTNAIARAVQLSKTSTNSAGQTCLDAAWNLGSFGSCSAPVTKLSWTSSCGN